MSRKAFHLSPLSSKEPSCLTKFKLLEQNLYSADTHRGPSRTRSNADSRVLAGKLAQQARFFFHDKFFALSSVDLSWDYQTHLKTYQ